MSVRPHPHRRGLPGLHRALGAASLAALALATALTLSACARTAAPVGPIPEGPPPAPVAPIAPAVSGTPAATPTAPDVERSLAHLRALAGTIGSRPTTTEAERRAAEYVRAQLEAAGYTARLESFEVDIQQRRTGSVFLPDGAIVPAAPMNGTSDGEATGPVVYAGLGRISELATLPARGAVLVVDRGEVGFAEKARAAQDAGAVALVVVNNVTGPFQGDITGLSTPRIPVVGVAQEDGPALRAQSGNTIRVRAESTRLRGRSQNVFARPSDALCTIYLGGHYDSVPAGPGAEDNASGISLLLELARVRRQNGVCIAAFGSEEVGLLGSKAFVRAHNVKDARFMLNFDMVGKITRPAFIGDRDLANRAVEIARARGVEARAATSVGPNAASDHASFAAEGVPVLMIYAGDDPFIHSPRDEVENVRRDDLTKFLDISVAILDALTGR